MEIRHLGFKYEGWIGDIDHITGDQGLTIEICLDCCHVVGMKPMTDEEIMAAFSEDE